MNESPPIEFTVEALMQAEKRWFSKVALFFVLTFAFVVQLLMPYRNFNVVGGIFFASTFALCMVVCTVEWVNHLRRRRRMQAYGV